MLEFIRNTIIEYVEIDPSQITPETRFIDDLNLNSYELISIVANLEGEYGINIPDSDLHSLLTVADLMEYLKDKVD